MEKTVVGVRKANMVKQGGKNHQGAVTTFPNKESRAAFQTVKQGEKKSPRYKESRAVFLHFSLIA